MTYTEAVQLRDRAKVLIGQKAEDSDDEIIDVVIVPRDCVQLFSVHYIRGIIASDFEKTYPSTDYDVAVVIGDDGVNILSDDIEAYMARI